MKLSESVKRAIETKDAKLAGKIADHLRAAGFNYRGIWEFVQKHAPEATAADWEMLLLEADEIEATE